MSRAELNFWVVVNWFLHKTDSFINIVDTRIFAPLFKNAVNFVLYDISLLLKLFKIFHRMQPTREIPTFKIRVGEFFIMILTRQRHFFLLEKLANYGCLCTTGMYWNIEVMIFSLLDVVKHVIKFIIIQGYLSYICVH